MQPKLFWEGPWMVAGRILQLTAWSERFQPTFEKLSLAAVWIQIHHLPIELWSGDILELVASQFGRVLKIDKPTIDRSRAKFARVCVLLDLNQPLQQGTWVNYGDHSAFVLVLYEKLPVFCYKCGKVGHGEAHCLLASSHQCSGKHVPSGSSRPEQVQADPAMQVDEAAKEQDGIEMDPDPTHLASDNEKEFGSWLKLRRCQVASRG